MPIDPQTGEELPYPGDPGFEQDPRAQQLVAQQQGGGAPPETLDGPVAPEMPLGISLNPAQMAAIALQAVAEIAGVDLAQFQAGQEAALEQTPMAIAAIMQQLKMQAAQPETLDGPVAPPGPDGAAPAGGAPLGPATTLPEDEEPVYA